MPARLKKTTANSLTTTAKQKTVDRSPKSVVKTPKQSGLSVPAFSLAGVAAGNLSLPKEVFGVKVNQSLLSQALRIYSNNQKGHFSSTKTRSEVAGSTRKIYAQKGTGRARHGAITAPIFVGGGIALGPKTRRVILELPKKMRKAALISALSQKLEEKKVLGVTNIDKATGKTKEMAKFLSKTSSGKGKATLIVTGEKLDKAQRAARNIPGVSLLTVGQINALEVTGHQSLILTKEAVDKLQARLKGEKS